MVKNSVASLLVLMSNADQAMRNKSSKDDSQWDSEMDKRNTIKLKEIVEKYGWPTISLVGEKASNAAWLLVQHADHDLSFQISCLNIMKNLPPDEIPRQNIAYLEDRVRVAQDRPQLYGTQFDNPGIFFGPKAIEDRPNLNKRRKAVGLSSFEDYKKLMDKTYGNFKNV